MTRLLVVDDNQQDLYMLQVLLEGHGHEVVSAGDGADALEKARGDPPEMIISDILMPVMDGFALCREWKKDEGLKDVPFVFYTATYIDPRDEEFALSLGAERFIVKPTEPEVLVEILGKVLEAHRAGRLVASQQPLEGEVVCFRKYNEALIRKLESSMVETEEANRRLAALHRAGVAMASIMGLPGSLPRVLNVAAEAMGCDRAMFFTYDDETKTLNLAAAAGFSEGMLEPLRPQLVFQLGEERGLVGLVGQTREALVVEDTTVESRWITVDETLRSALLVPVAHDEHMLGVMVFFDTQAGVFHHEHALNAMTLAATMAVAIENTRLCERAQQEIAERRRAEEELRRLKEFHEDIVQSMSEGIAVQDADGYYTFVNPAAASMFGRTPAELVGQHWTASIPPGQQPVVLGASERRVRGETDRYELVLVHDDERRLSVLVSGSPRFEEGRFVGTMAVLTDITEHKRAEEELRGQERLAAVGQLAGGIAHDFNNLLTTIMLNAEIPLGEPDLPPDLGQAFETILSQSNLAAQLVQQILDFSRSSPIETQPVALGPLIKDALGVLQRTIPESISLVLEEVPGECVVNADSTRIQQVLMNLVFNARDAMPEGGKLRIGLSPVETRPGQEPPVEGLPSGKWVCLTVSDTGSGVPADVLPRIFEPFVTTKPREKGTGLGLAQVHGIVKQHDGYVGVETEMGRGTTFRVCLPAYQVTGEVVEEANSHIGTPEGKGETILLVEDDEGILKAGRGILEALGYRVLAAADGLEALKLFHSAGKLDLVLTDLVMPRMGGAELIRELRKADPHLKMLVMTGHVLTEDVQDLTRQGILEVVQKPLELSTLARAVRRALATD